MTIGISIASRKGGVGKSSMTAGIASYLSSLEKRVLAVDLDPQSNLAYMLGNDPTQPGTAELLEGKEPDPLYINDFLHVLPGGPELLSAVIARMDQNMLLHRLRDWDYDVILFDSPPGNEHLERLGVIASQKALVVTNAHPLAVLGAQRVLEELVLRKQHGWLGPKVWGIVANMIDPRRSLDQHVETLFTNEQGVPFFQVPQDINVAMASACRTPLFDYQPKTKASSVFKQIADWCMEGMA